MLNLLVPLSSAQENTTFTVDNDNSIPLDNDDIASLDNWQFTQLEISPSESSPNLHENSLVGYWNFDDGQGDIAHDNSGWSPPFVDGKLGKALEFNGDESVNVVSDASLSPALITVSAQIYPTQFPAVGEPNDHFMGKWESGGYQYVAYLAAGGNGEVRFQVRGEGGGINESRSNVSVPLNAWSHFAATWDGSDIKIYINGVENTTVVYKQFSGAIAGGASPLKIGFAASVGFYGRIDEVMIYNQALGPENINQNFSATEPTQVVTSGLVSWWRFEGDLTDSWGSNHGGNHGIIYGATWVDGKIGKALSFDGVDDTVSMGDVLDFERDNTWTIAAWVKTDNSNHGAVVSKIYNGHIGYDLFVVGTTFMPDEPYFGKVAVHIIHEWAAGARNAIRKYSENRVDDNEWHHIAYTYDGSSSASGINIYIDGVLNNGDNTHNNLSATILNEYPLRVGSREGINYFRGLIDEVMIFSHVLSPEEVSELFGGAVMPTSKVDTIEPYWQNQVPFTITATTGGAVENVELWHRYSPDNSDSSWEDWALFDVDNDNSDGWSWEFTAPPENDGYYEFYSIATDAVDNREQAPDEADARCGVDRQPPDTEISSLRLALAGPPPIFWILVDSQENLSGISKIELCYRYSPGHLPGSDNWSPWDNIELPLENIEVYLWEVYADNIGLYEFYSRATDYAGNIEEDPVDQNMKIVPDASWEAKTYRVAYIPVRYVGSPEPEPIHKIENRAATVRDYYWQQSLGKVILLNDFVYDDWHRLDKRLSDYPSDPYNWCKNNTWGQLPGADAIEDAEIDPNAYNAVVVIQPEKIISFRTLNRVMLDDGDAYSIWAHELGHAIWGWRDYYGEGGNFGDIHRWGIMGRTSCPGNIDINPIPPVMPYHKVQENWLNYHTISSNEYGDYRVKRAGIQISGDNVYRYSTKQGVTKYYIVEYRRTLGFYPTFTDPWNEWTYPIDVREGILLYRVEEHDGEDYVYTVPHYKEWYWWNVDEHMTPTLLPGETFKDDEACVQFTASDLPGGYMNLNISEHIPEETTLIHVPYYLSNLPIPSAAQSENLSSYFDVDLHVYTYDGKHVGPLYDVFYDNESTVYEIGIENANTSRNTLGGGSEWISVPDNVAVYAVVDATPARRWAEELGIDLENVEITATVQIIHYDENGVRQESSPLTLDVSLTEPTLLTLPAVVDIDPDTLNLGSNGKWVTAYIELPENYGVEHVRGEPYELEVETDGELTARQQELVDNLIQEIDAALATVDLELEADEGTVEVELDGYLSEQGQALLDELIQELEQGGNEAEFSIEKEINWGNYRTTIDISSIKLENVPAVSDSSYGFVREPELEDRDHNGLPELMVKFDRSAVQSLLQPGDVKLTIRGKLVDLLPFEGSDTIRVR